MWPRVIVARSAASLRTLSVNALWPRPHRWALPSGRAIVNGTGARSPSASISFFANVEIMAWRGRKPSPSMTRTRTIVPGLRRLKRVRRNGHRVGGGTIAWRLPMKNWLVVANAARARVFEDAAEGEALHTVADLVHTQSRQKGTDLASDRPGHVEGPRPLVSVAVAARSTGTDGRGLDARAMVALSGGHAAVDFANGALVGLLPFLRDRFHLSYT